MPTPQETRIIQEVKSQMDPSSLTTQQLWREIASLKELLETRIEAVEKAIDVAHDDLVRFPTDIDKSVTTLKELHEKWFMEKFSGIETLLIEKYTGIEKQFNERDVRVEQTARDTKTAVDAALAAQEKAVGKQNESFALSITKSETAIAKQIDQQGLLIQQNAKSFDDKINDIKDRITTIEGIAVGGMATKASAQTSSSSIWGIVAVVSSIILGIIGLIAGYVMSR